MRRLSAVLAFFLFVTPAWPASLGPTLPPGLESGGDAVVAAVIDGDSLTLSDGRTVRLVGLQAPKLPKGRRNFPEWPLALEAKAALEALVAGQAVTLYYGGAHADRYGRALAHLVRTDALWIEGEMLRVGMARVYTFSDNRAVAQPMLALEQEARAAHRGIWADPFYAIRTPEEAVRYEGSYEIVEGRIVDAARTQSGVFLNFGADWRTAFTLRLRPDALKLFRAAGSDPLALNGKTVRVRGWIRRDRLRAVIDITHPEEIEIL